MYLDETAVAQQDQQNSFLSVSLQYATEHSLLLWLREEGIHELSARPGRVVSCWGGY